jgi:HPt (histidine-containing phosphotransfer) domain-containing protein
MPTQIEKLGSAVAAGDSRVVEQQAHKIKDASASLGGMSLEQVAYGMELAGKAGDAKKLQELMSQLAKQFEILRAFLEKA